jgi:hypothetical protein
VGGLFVLRGGYHAPSEKEQEEIEADDAAEAPQQPQAEPQMNAP